MSSIIYFYFFVHTACVVRVCAIETKRNASEANDEALITPKPYRFRDATTRLCTTTMAPLASPGTTSVVRVEPSVVFTMCDRCDTRARAIERDENEP